MLIRSWLEHQGPSIRSTLANRVSLRHRGRRSDDLLAPYRMDHVRLVTHFDDGFLRFAKRLPRRLSPVETLTSVLRFAAARSPIIGEVAVPPDRWGSVVLSSDWADVSKSDGSLVRDALLAERIGIDATDEARRQRITDVLAMVHHAPEFDASGCVSGYVSRCASGCESCNATPASASAPDPSGPPNPPPGGGRRLRPREIERQEAERRRKAAQDEEIERRRKESAEAAATAAPPPPELRRRFEELGIRLPEARKS